MGPFLTCRDASRLISQLEDGSLPPLKRWLVRLHLLGCDACRGFVRQLRFLREALRRYRT